MAIGGNWPGFTIDNNAFPANMYVDYVRVYQNTQQPQGVATVYKDCNYGGYAVGLPAGSYTLAQLQSRGVADNDISSVRVQSGYQIRLYQNNNFTGTSVVKTGDDACLVDDGFNDAATSVVVSAVSSGFSQTIQAESYSAMSGVQTEGTSDSGGGLNVGWIDTNDWMAYNNINIPATGSYRLEYRVASPSGGRLSQDLNGGAIVLGAVNVPATGGWQTWTTISQTVNINAGTYNFGIFAATGGWNINWWRITQLSTSGAAFETPVVISEMSREKPRALRLYPNPATSELNIQADDTESVIKIVNSYGAEVFRGKVGDGKLDISQLPNGIYTISTSTEVKRFIKK
jgi:hypothetical protein